MTSSEPSAHTVRHVHVVVVSTSAAQGSAEDRTGPELVAWATSRGWRATLQVVADGPAVDQALRDALLGEQPDLVVTTGGTGVSPTDRTPEYTRPWIDLELPGIAEELRRRGSSAVPTAVLTRGVAGIAGRTVVLNLPGSPGAVRDGIAVLTDVLEHLWDQLKGGDHGSR